jgi:protein-disulfide isomerase
MNRKILFISGVVLILLAFTVATMLYKKQELSLPGISSGPGLAVLERSGAPIKGPENARVTIVEFFDPACGTCADFYPLVQQLVDRYPGKVRVMMRYAPLHSGSDQVVTILEAAHRQGKFWEALELLFANQRRWVANHVSQPMRARALMNGLALDHGRLDIDVNLAEIARAIQKDVEDGQALGVQATPEFIVNGRRMPSFGYKQLSLLVKEAVDEAYPE